MLRLVSFQVARFHSIRTSAPFLIALILQWQLLSLAQVCRSSFPRTLIALLENLYICEDGYPRLGWQDDTENAQWMEFLHYFTAVKNLILSKEFALCIAPVLRELVGEGVVEILPAPQSLF